MLRRLDNCNEGHGQWQKPLRKLTAAHNTLCDDTNSVKHFGNGSG
jgi:hypothetical protein